ncbi:uncharacterized protein LOC143462683 isoform X2 [Clavelina lepadiformis]|uniref:Uncharacterized protein n=1 Tax=Clavelina lepadiformis TaxID=159417 RepID=A0ABP0GMW9_CLALP
MTSLLLTPLILLLFSSLVFGQEAPPAIRLSSPPSVTGRVGESLLLRCSITGEPKPEITWRKFGRPISNTEEGIRVSGGELTIASLSTADRGSYECQGRNSRGQVEHTTTVHVKAPPEFRISPKNVTVKEGQTAFFSCKATGYPTPIRYSWLYNGQPVRKAAPIRGRYSARGDGTLVIRKIRKGDKAQVTCKADNGFGTAPNASAFLIVQYAARVTNIPAIVYGGLGLSTAIPCPSEAEPPVNTVTWRKNRQVILPQQTDRIRVDANGSLHISNIRFNDKGQYTCTPYNILGNQAESPEVRLDIREPPRFALRPQSVFEVEIGRPLTANCIGIGDPKPTIRWQKIGGYGERLPNSRVFWEIGNVTFNSITKEDHGLWQCVVSNAVTEITSDVKINVKYTTPHQISNITVTTSHQSAEIAWEPGYDGGYPQHFMIWHKRADKDDSGWKSDSFHGGHKMAVIKRLEPETVYEFAILPENVLGSGSFSKTVTAKTKMMPTAPPPIHVNDVIPLPPRHFSYTRKPDGIIALSWDPPLFILASDLLGYLVEYRIAPENIRRQHPAPSFQNAAERPASRHRRGLLTRVKRRLAGRDIDPTSGRSRGALVQEMWHVLASYLPNTTTCEVPNDRIYRDQVYEFRVLIATSNTYSLPSTSVFVDTKGMTSYPVPANISSGNKMATGTWAGIIVGVLLVIVAFVAAAVFCYCQKGSHRFQRGNYLKEDGTESFLSSQKSDTGSFKKTNPAHSSDLPPVTFTKRDLEDEVLVSNKNGVLQRLRTKFDKSSRDADTQKHLLLKNNLVRRSKSASQATSNSQIASITRSSDGKFRVTASNSHSSQDKLSRHKKTPKHYAESDSEEIRRSCMRRKIHERKLRPVSDSFVKQDSAEKDEEQNQRWPPHVPENTIIEREEERGPRLEIDCSQSDIEVRYVRRDSHDFRGSHQSSSLQQRQQKESFSKNVPTDRNPDAYQRAMTSNATESLPRRLPSYEKRNSRDDGLQPLCPSAEYVYLRDIGLPCPETPFSDARGFSPDVVDANYQQNAVASQSCHSLNEPMTEQLLRFSPEAGSPKTSSSGRWRRRGSSPDVSSKSMLSGGYNSFNGSRGDHNWASSLDRRRKYSLTLPVVEEGDCITSIEEEDLSRRNSQLRQSLQCDSSRKSQPPSVKTARKFNTHSCSLPSLSLNKSPPPVRPEVLTEARESMYQRSYSEEAILKSDTDSEQRCSFTSGSTSTVRRLHSRDSNLSEVGRIGTGENHLGSCVSNSGKIEVLPNLQSPTSEISSSSLTPPLQPGGAGSTSGYDSHCTSSDTSYEPGTRCFDYGDFPTQQFHYGGVNSSSVYHENQCSNHVNSPSRSEYRDQRMTNLGVGCNLPGVRCSNASSSESRSRKDNSSVDDKYEWDSESAMESEILDTLKNFESPKRDSVATKGLVQDLRKFSVDRNLPQNSSNEAACFASGYDSREGLHDQFLSLSSAEDNYSRDKERMERRCAALKEEYQRYQRRHRIQFDESLSYDSSC